MWAPGVVVAVSAVGAAAPSCSIPGDAVHRCQLWVWRFWLTHWCAGACPEKSNRADEGAGAQK